MGDKYAWRSADGSNNNIESPDIGKAGDPYARSVAQATPLPPHLLPDPELVFDTLLRRDKVCTLSQGLSLGVMLILHYCNSVQTPPRWSFVPDVLLCRPGHPLVRHGHERFTWIIGSN